MYLWFLFGDMYIILLQVRIFNYLGDHSREIYHTKRMQRFFFIRTLFWQSLVFSPLVTVGALILRPKIGLVLSFYLFFSLRPNTTSMIRVDCLGCSFVDIGFQMGHGGHTWTEFCFLYSFRFQKVVHYQWDHYISILCIFFWKISPATLKGILCEVHLRRDISSLWQWWYKSSAVEIQSFGTTWSCKFFNGTHCLQVGVMFGHVCCLLLFTGLADFRW